MSAETLAFLPALLAADATTMAFRPQDVRFFYLLFTNWMGDDRLLPSSDLDATQTRRAMERHVAAGLAVAEGGRPPRWRLTPRGVADLVDALTDPRRPKRLEEVVLLVSVAASYGPLIAKRARGAGGADERRARARLEPAAIVRAEVRRLTDALDDMERRRDAGPRLAEAGRRALDGGASPIDAANALARTGLPYQLHPMRPLPELIAALPPELQRYELAEGPAWRSQAMFGPLADELRARSGRRSRMAMRAPGVQVRTDPG
jgi:hypothetical protein